MELINEFLPQKNSEGILEIEISERWALWGPNGGYLAAIALMSISKTCEGFTPVSFSCQFLNVASFANVQIKYVCLKDGYKAKAYEVMIEQEGRLILKAQIWLSKYVDALKYDHTPKTNWQSLDKSPLQGWGSHFTFWKNIDVKNVSLDLDNKRVGNDGFFSSWFKFVKPFDVKDRWLNAARVLVLADTLQWFGTWAKYDEDKLKYMAPSLDLTMHFHDLDNVSKWLFGEALANIANNGFVTNHANIRNEQGDLIATGTGRLICKRSPV